MKNYIEKVIISILNQSFQNFEIIIVNDHSKDKSLEVIKKLHFKDQRIKLIIINIPKKAYIVNFVKRKTLLINNFLKELIIKKIQEFIHQE